MRGIGRGAWFVSGAVLVMALLFPAVMPDAYLIIIVGTGLVFGMLAMSLDLLWGYSGILNLAPALSFGIGAYTWGILSNEADGSVGTLYAVVVAVSLAALLAAGLAFVSFRSGATGIYFALMTLAATLVCQQIAQVSTDLTGGSNGLVVFTWPTFGIPGVAEFSFDTPTSLYYLILAVVALTLGGAAWLVSSRFGTVLKAVRESDQRTETLGYSPMRHRVLISACAAALAALAGVLYAPMTGIVDPSVFGVALSVQVFVWVAVGGAGTLVGPLIAAVLLTSGQATLSGASATLYLLVTGVGFILVVLFLPGGLASLPRRLGLGRTGAHSRPPSKAPTADADRAETVVGADHGQ